jgi:hypothetical protein
MNKIIKMIIKEQAYCQNKSIRFYATVMIISILWNTKK